MFQLKSKVKSTYAGINNKTKKLKIAFSGKMASGKTSLANYLVVHRGFTRIALADPIKEIEAELDILSPIEITDKHMVILDPMEKAIFCKILEEAKLIPKETPKPRKRLQFIGTEGARHRIANDIWIRLGNERASKYDDVCIDDVRFMNEFDYFSNEKKWCTVVLHITPEVQQQRLKMLYGDFDPSILQHPSETEIEKIFESLRYNYLIDTSHTTVNQAGERLLELLDL